MLVACASLWCAARLCRRRLSVRASASCARASPQVRLPRHHSGAQGSVPGSSRRLAAAAAHGAAGVGAVDLPPGVRPACPPVLLAALFVLQLGHLSWPATKPTCSPCAPAQPGRTSRLEPTPCMPPQAATPWQPAVRQDGGTGPLLPAVRPVPRCAAPAGGGGRAQRAAGAVCVPGRLPGAGSAGERGAVTRGGAWCRCRRPASGHKAGPAQSRPLARRIPQVSFRPPRSRVSIKEGLLLPFISVVGWP